MVLVSGSGTNLQALIDAENRNAFDSGNGVYGKIAVVVSDRQGAYALERAKIAGIPAIVAEPDKKLPREQRRLELSDRIYQIAVTHNAGLLVLAGFLSILSGKIIRDFTNRIINLHPALLPKFGGRNVRRTGTPSRARKRGKRIGLYGTFGRCRNRYRAYSVAAQGAGTAGRYAGYARTADSLGRTFCHCGSNGYHGKTVK